MHDPDLLTLLADIADRLRMIAESLYKLVQVEEKRNDLISSYTRETLDQRGKG